MKIPALDDDNDNNKGNDINSTRNDNDDGNKNEKNTSISNTDADDSNEKRENYSINSNKRKQLGHPSTIKDEIDIQHNRNYNEHDEFIKNKEEVIQSNNTLDEGTH